MLRKLKISTRLWILNGLMIVIAFLSFLIFYVNLERIKSYSSDMLYDEMLQLKKQKIQAATVATAKIIEKLCENISDEQEQLAIIKNTLYDIRYDTSSTSYFSVYKGSVMQVFPPSPAFEGKDLGDSADSTGVFYIRDLVKKVNSGGGFVQFWLGGGSNSAIREARLKLLYGTPIKGTPYWIGNGFYIDNILNAKEELQLELGDVQKTSFFSIVLGVGFFLAFVVMPISWQVRKSITQPIAYLSEQLQSLGKGLKVDLISSDNKHEIGLITESVNQVIQEKNRAADFASAIGEENFDFEYEKQSEDDVLGISLMAMRDNLKEHRNAEAARHWKNDGLALFSSITHSQVDDLGVLGKKLISEIVKYIGANQGCIYRVPQDGEKVMERMATYAWGRVKYVKEAILPGEGLVGQAWLEKEPTYLEEIPDEYLIIKSGLGEACPKMIYILPLISNDEVQGMLEIASFKKLNEIEKSFLESLAESLGAWLWSISNTEKTKALLEESQHLSATLQAGEEEIRQNMEELQATHEEMRRREESYKRQIEELKAEKAV
ncbi:cache domain-containing protein [Flammeovirgaceae bacterium SG7u.111]|nr:cache domain-containing protein [Flammeovirgaceae bacterium SG7u.132]WPO35948.1 cache domain-containing protein [Flammeovirgaceae bacterium SG7u.111]